MILIDSNVLIDIIENDPEWRQWSLDQIVNLSVEHALAVNQIVVAEVAPSMGSIGFFIDEMDKLGIKLESIDDESAFAAGMAFRSYRARRQQAEPKSILADFLIGGHAQVAGASILTRDPRFYRAYFPSVALFAPDQPGD